jgi:uncharacterized membrane protein
MANKSKKEQKKDSESKPKTQSEEARKASVRVPLLIDFTLSVAKIIVILVGILTAAISILAGATVLIAAVRSAAAILVVGLTFWMVNWWIASYALEAVRLELIDGLEAKKNPPSTMEKTA